MNPLKVLVLPSWYPTIDDPVNGIFFREQAEVLNQYVDVAVLYLNPVKFKQPKKFLFAKRKNTIRENGLLTCQFNYEWMPRNITLRHKVYEKRLIEGYMEVIEHFGKPDIIHAHVSYPAGYGAMILGHKFKTPFIVTEHASFFQNFLITKYGNYLSQVLTEADYYTAVSSYVQNIITKNGRKQCEVVPNFINVDKFNLVNKPKIEQVDLFNLVHISLMNDTKRIDILLRSLHMIIFIYNYKNIHLSLIGDGPDRQKYEDLASELGLQDYCTFHGYVDNNELGRYLSSSNALVISSKIETFCISGIESMACGLPVISTRCGGPEDYITDDVGILVENEDVDSLSKGIIEMIDNYDKYDANKIKKYVHDNYSAQVVCEKIVSIYQNLILPKS